MHRKGTFKQLQQLIDRRVTAARRLRQHWLSSRDASSPRLWCGALSIVLLAFPLPLSVGIGSTSALVQTANLLAPSAILLARKDNTARKDNATREDNADSLQAIAQAQVVYLGETHSDRADHAAQLEIIQAMAERGEVAIALEMFQRPFQAQLDAYIADELSEAELIVESEYETRWGFDWELYAPILRYAKANQIPLIALNTPAEVTRQVAQTGLESLDGDALTHIPPLADIDTGNEAYRTWMNDVFSAHAGEGHSLDFENFFAAQVLWDETMAERVVQQLESEPARQVIVLAGEGHIAYGYGIPSRVMRRVPDIKQVSVQLLGADEATRAGLADFFWITD
ncbi:MAG: ChaN family lipoprotein [Phormidesmis sp.]